MSQSLIRSHANDPDPKDVARVRMVLINAGHGSQRNRPMNRASMRRRYGRCNQNLTRRFEGRGHLRSRSHV